MSTSSTSALPINNLINVNQPSATSAAGLSGSTSLATTSSSSAGTLDQTSFLTLLTTELQNQDPLNPMDDTQSIAQLANFSTLQSQQELTSSFQQFQSTFSILQSASLIGQTVTANDPNAPNSSVTGQITGVSVQAGVPYYTMSSSGSPVVGSDGAPFQFTPSQITGIGGS